MLISLEDIHFTTFFGLLFFAIAAADAIYDKMNGKGFPAISTFFKSVLVPYAYGWLGLFIGKPLYATFGDRVATVGLAVAVAAILVSLLSCLKKPKGKDLQTILWHITRITMRLAFACAVYAMWCSW